MKKAIIEQMRKELYPSHWCEQDFEYDLETIHLMDRFIWCVYGTGTIICDLSEKKLNKYKDNEQLRFTLYRDPEAIISSIKCMMDIYRQYKLFYFNGTVLKRITDEEVMEIYGDICADYVMSIVDAHPDEFDMRNRNLDLVFASDSTKNRFMECMGYAKAIHDKSLEIMVTGLVKYPRYAKDHKIVIGHDPYDKSFSFVETINGKRASNGGIVYDSACAYSHWQIHT